MPAYLVGAAFFLLIWALFYALAPRARSEALIASVGLTYFGPVLEYVYLNDYWAPEYVWSISLGEVPIALEDYVFGFALSGLAAGVFALLLPVSRDPGERSTTRAHTWWRLQAAAAAFVLANFLLADVAGV